MRTKFLTSAIIPLLLFAILLPVSNFINFYQNDDWCYYLTVENFLSGKFVLHPIVAPTLYAQAFLGMVFAKVFGISQLPVLTLLLSCVSLYFFILILREFFNLNLKWAVLIGMLFFLNPLSVYEIWGFMTGQYFQVFFVSALYFILKFDKTLNKKFFFVYLILVFIGLLVRQTAMVLPLAVAIYYFSKNQKKLSILNFIYFGILFLFYSKILPLAPRVAEVPLQIQNFTRFDYLFALVFGSVVVLVAYTLPLIINLFTKKFLLFSLGFIVIVFLIFNQLFKPNSTARKEFPYFENVVERTGFYPRGVNGTKYQFRGNYDLWRYWDVTSKILVSALCIYLLVNSTKYKFSVFSIYIILYLAIMITIGTFYDRYLLPLVPVFILFLINRKSEFSKINKIIILGFICFLGYLTYLFSADFLLVNHYIWNKSLSLVEENNLDPKYIQGTNAWKLTNRNLNRDYVYTFSYDSQEVNERFKTIYNLVEVKEIQYPLNIFVNSKVFLYRIKN